MKPGTRLTTVQGPIQKYTQRCPNCIRNAGKLRCFPGLLAFYCSRCGKRWHVCYKYNKIVMPSLQTPDYIYCECIAPPEVDHEEPVAEPEYTCDDFADAMKNQLMEGDEVDSETTTAHDNEDVNPQSLKGHPVMRGRRIMGVLGWK